MKETKRVRRNEDQTRDVWKEKKRTVRGARMPQRGESRNVQAFHKRTAEGKRANKENARCAREAQKKACEVSESCRAAQKEELRRERREGRERVRTEHSFSSFQ